MVELALDGLPVIPWVLRPGEAALLASLPDVEVFNDHGLLFSSREYRSWICDTARDASEWCLVTGETPDTVWELEPDVCPPEEYLRPEIRAELPRILLRADYEDPGEDADEDDIAEAVISAVQQDFMEVLHLFWFEAASPRELVWYIRGVGGRGYQRERLERGTPRNNAASAATLRGL